MIKKFYKKVKNEDNETISVLDFDAIRADGNHINIILSERFRQGKTVSSMNHILRRFINHNETAVLILNTQELFDANKTKLIAMNKVIYPELWEPVKMTKRGLFYNDTIFCMFVPLSAWGKFKIGTRPANITTIIYDEFNVSDRLIRTTQTDHLLNILMSASPKGKCIIFAFCNNLTLNVTLLTRLGFTEFTDNEIQYRKFGNMKLMFYVPKTSAEQRKIIAKEKNWNNSLARLLGQEGMTVFNEDNYDNNSGVVPRKEHYIYKETTYHHYFYFDNNCYAQVWTGGPYGQLFLEYHNRKPVNAAVIYALNKKKTDQDIKFDELVRMEWLQEFKNGNLLFSDLALKSYFLKEVL